MSRGQSSANVAITCAQSIFFKKTADAPAPPAGPGAALDTAAHRSVSQAGARYNQSGGVAPCRFPSNKCVCVCVGWTVTFCPPVHVASSGEGDHRGGTAGGTEQDTPFICCPAFLILSHLPDSSYSGEDFHPTSNTLIHGTHVPTKEGVDRMVEDVEKQ